KAEKERVKLLELREQRDRNYGSLMDNVYIKVSNGEYPNWNKIDEKINILVQNILMYPLNDVIKEKLKLKTRHEYKTFSNLKDVKKYPEYIVKLAYRRYRKLREQQDKENTTQRLRPPKSNIKEYVLNYIVALEKEDILKTEEEIDDLTIFERKSSETLDKTYEYYKEQHNRKFQRINNFNGNINFNEAIYPCFKSKDKINKLKDNGITFKDVKDYTINSFPLKKNLKSYGLHMVALPYSYLVDLMFENMTYCYLVMININTRKLWVIETNFVKPTKDSLQNLSEEELKRNIKEGMKSSESIIHAMNQLIKQGMKIRYIRGDGEGGFNSRITQDFYKRNNIIPCFDIPRIKTSFPSFMNGYNMVKKQKTEPNHSSLGLIDRVIRTIRDMAYNMKIRLITPDIMQKIVYLYNNSPHSTLSKYAGQSVSPEEVDNDPELEDFITRKIKQENYIIMNSPGFNLSKGSNVDVYNVDSSMAKRRTINQIGKFKVNDRRGAMFEVINDETGEKQILPRYKLSLRF
ncbi:MAG: hypothetical protein SO176_02090, partial [Bacilli bacterium]|nr:hypothetical protein [Bacilli bacterium]